MEKYLAGKGRLSTDGERLDREFWAHSTPEQRIQAVFLMRQFYYEVLHPGTGAERLDPTIEGTRRLGEPSPD
ncbi:MAG: hypothetical protein SFX74_09635 [Fimbriimonadaceae bacterium]|nr:hypothetical protein [Fimbriimonadaceae bacterium]